jgi:hypothetical protein
MFGPPGVVNVKSIVGWLWELITNTSGGWARSPALIVCGLALLVGETKLGAPLLALFEKGAFAPMAHTALASNFTVSPDPQPKPPHCDQHSWPLLEKREKWRTPG